MTTTTTPAAVASADPDAAPAAALTVTVRDAQHALADLLAVLGRARQPWPVLAGVHLRADTATGTLTLTVTNRVTSLRRRIPYQGHPIPETLINAKTTATWVNKQRRDGTLSISRDGQNATLTCGASAVRVLALPVDDFPDIPEPPTGVGVTLAGDQLQAIATRVAPFAYPHHDSLPWLRRTHLILHDHTIRAAASDRYRAAILDYPATGPIGEAYLSMPPAVLRRAARTTLGHTDVITLRHDGDWIWLSTPDTTWSTLTITDDHEPVNVDKLAGDTIAAITIDRKQAIDEITLVSVVGAGAPIRLTAHTDRLALTMSSGDEAHAESAIPATHGPDQPHTAAFNPKLLTDALNSLRGQHAGIALGVKDKPAILTSPDDPDYRHLLMPVRLAG